MTTATDLSSHADAAAAHAASVSEPVNQIAGLLDAFLKSPGYAQRIARVNSVDWSKASLQERQAVRNEIMSAPEMQAVVAKARFFGFATSGVGGMISGSVVVGGAGGGGVLWRDGAEDKGVGFAFGSAGPSIGGSADFLFMCYRGLPKEFYGLMHGAFAHVHLVAGVGAFTGHLGAGWDSRWEYLLFAVGAGVSLGAGGFVGGAWLY